MNSWISWREKQSINYKNKNTISSLNPVCTSSSLTNILSFMKLKNPKSEDQQRCSCDLNSALYAWLNSRYTQVRKKKYIVEKNTQKSDHLKSLASVFKKKGQKGFTHTKWDMCVMLPPIHMLMLCLVEENEMGKERQPYYEQESMRTKGC